MRRQGYRDALKYLGDSEAHIVVKQRARVHWRKKWVVIFDDQVAPGELFTLEGVDRKGTLGTEIILYVDGEEHVRIHTSCSQPIGPGLIKGDFLVVEAFSRRGGRICPINQCALDAGPPVIQYSMLSNTQIQIRVTDDTGLSQVVLHLNGALSLTDSNFTVGATEASYVVDIVNLSQDATIQVEAQDLCGKTPCAGIAEPPVIREIAVSKNSTYAVGTIADELGIQSLEFFNLKNAEVVENSLTPGDTLVTFRINKVDTREVAVLVNGYQEAGIHQITFDAQGLPGGTYLYRLEVPGQHFVGKLVVVH